jgi:hypothetical protein
VLVQHGQVGAKTGRDAAPVGESEKPCGDEARHQRRLAKTEARHARDEGGARTVAPEQQSGRQLGRIHDEVARQCDPLGPGYAHGQLLHTGMNVTPVRDQAQRHSFVEQELGDRTRRARSQRSHRIPEVRGETSAGIHGGPHGGGIRARVSHGGDCLLGHERDCIESARNFRRDRDQADVITREPLAEEWQVDGLELVDRNRTRDVRIQERALEVKAQTQAFDRRARIARGEEVTGDTGFLDASRRVDVKVEKAGKNDRSTYKIVVALDRGNATFVDD